MATGWQARLDAWCARAGDARRRVRDGERTTVGALMAAEPLAPVPAVPFPAVLEDERVVSAQALVAWHGNSYSVPPGHGGQRVTVRHQLGSGTINVVTASGTVLARHRRQPDHAGAVVRDEGHVTALETKVLAARGQDAWPVRPQGAAPAVGRGDGGGRRDPRRVRVGDAGHRLRRVGFGGQAAEPARQELTGRPGRVRRTKGKRGFTMSFTVPAAGQDEPEISVPVSVIGDTAELLALAAELIDTAPGAREQIEALMDRKGAEPGPPSSLDEARRSGRSVDEERQTTPLRALMPVGVPRACRGHRCGCGSVGFSGLGLRGAGAGGRRCASSRWWR